MCLSKVFTERTKNKKVKELAGKKEYIRVYKAVFDNSKQFYP